MGEGWVLAAGYIAVINVCTFFVYGWDKRCAVKGRWRVSEKTLLLLAAAGGSVGALMGMRRFRHKTRKNKFRFGVPLIFALQTAVLAAGIYYLTR